MEKDVEESLLPQHGVEGQSEHERHLPHLQRRRTRVLEFSVALNIILLSLGCIVWFTSFFSQQVSECQGIFTPAHEAIEYTTKVFRTGLEDDRTEYQGPGEEALQSWEALYDNIAMTQIDKATAQQLPNATAPASFDHSQYVVQLDVFHTLHCLSILRKRLYPDVYPPDNAGEDGIKHLEHCVESIRQSLQCFSDVSTIYWEWSEKTQRMLGNTKTTHTCRNFEKIQTWARKHSLPQHTDFLQHVPGAPLMQEY